MDIGRSPHPLADAIRALSFMCGAATLCVALVVTMAYLSAYRRHRAAVTAGTEKRSWRGLLPRHVALIGFAYVALVIASMWETVLRLREPITPFGMTYLASYAAGLWSMWDILGYERRQIQDLSSRRSPRR